MIAGKDRRADRGPRAEPGEAHQGGGPHRVREEEAQCGVSPPAGHGHRDSGPGNNYLETLRPSIL